MNQKIPAATEPVNAFAALRGALDAAAEALVDVAVQRNQITANHLIRETETNLRILAAIPANL